MKSIHNQVYNKIVKHKRESCFSHPIFPLPEVF